MDILALLQWLIPSGGVGLLLGWLTSGRIRRARSRREEHDTYMHMYDDTQQTLLKLSHDNHDMLMRVARLEATLAKAYNCKHWHQCPMRRELMQLSATSQGDNGLSNIKDYLREHEPQGTRQDDDGSTTEREHLDEAPSDRPP